MTYAQLLLTEARGRSSETRDVTRLIAAPLCIAYLTLEYSTAIPTFQILNYEDQSQGLRVE